MTPALIGELSALGPVRWLFVPNCFHHLGTPAAAKAFPEAKVVGPRSACAKNPQLKIDVEAGAPHARVPGVELLPLLGVPFLDETVLFHQPSRTLIGADIVMTACARDHWTWRTAGFLTGCYDKLRLPPDVRKKIEDKQAARRALDAILKRPAERLLVAHADTLGADWASALDEAWRLVGV
jgi:hypothetical protein